MKKVYVMLLLSGLATGMAKANALQTDSVKKIIDTVTFKKDTLIIQHDGGHKYQIKVGAHGKHANMDILRDDTQKPAKPGFSVGLTFSKFDLGFTTLLDNGSFTLRPQNQFLDYNAWKTSTVGFDLWKFGYRFTDQFKLSMGAGFDWTLIRLNKDITILRDQPTLTYQVDNIHYSKNRFSSTYLRVPLYFDFRSAAGRFPKRFHVIVSPEAGFLIEGEVKQISDMYGKRKAFGNYNFTHFRYGLTSRIGYGSTGIFFKYYFNDMFENSPQQAGLKNFALGFTFGLK